MNLRTLSPIIWTAAGAIGLAFVDGFLVAFQHGWWRLLALVPLPFALHSVRSGVRSAYHLGKSHAYRDVLERAEKEPRR